MGGDAYRLNMPVNAPREPGPVFDENNHQKEQIYR